MNRVVVGAIWDDEAGLDAGAAYVFSFDQGLWIQEQKLLPDDLQPNGELGAAVAVHADALIVGTDEGDGITNGTGAAYLYRRREAMWQLEQKLFAADGGPGDGFGDSMALEGDIAVIGAPGANDLGSNAGAAYAFRFDGKTWIEEQKLLASDGSSADFFGWSVALAGDWILIGAPKGEGLTRDSGCAYMFHWDGASWIEQQKLIANDIDAPGDSSIADDVDLTITSSGGVAILGQPNDTEVDGSAYVFNHVDGSWIQVQELYSPEDLPGMAQQFGRAVAIEGEIILVGEPFGETTGPSDGAAYIFRYDYSSQSWVLQEQLLPEPLPSASTFGQALDISGGIAIIAADGEMSSAGRVYVFNVDPAPADLDCDSVIGPADLAELLAQWGECPAKGECSADIAPPPPDGGDGIVGPADLAELLANWGS